MLITGKEVTVIGFVFGTVLLVFLLWLLIRFLRKDPYPYERRELLTENEKILYQPLLRIAEDEGLVLLVKLRLADIMAVKKKEKDYMSAFNKIKAKHTDFVLCDPQTMEVVCGIELDDRSHLQKERIERDIFVDGAYRACGIPLIHVWNPISEEELRERIEDVI